MSAQQSTPIEVLPGYEDVVDLYARVSTDPQEKKKTSHAKQLRMMRERIVELELREGIAVEETYTATSRNRPELDRIMQRVRQGVVGVVMVANPDRFVRDQIDLGVLLDTFREHGVGLVSAQEGLDSRKPNGVMMWSNYAMMAEWEHHRIFDRTMGAKLAQASEGRIPTGARGRVYGYVYDKETKTWTVNGDEAEIVRRMFAWAAAGATTFTISTRLIEENVPTATGGTTWRTTTVLKMLHNRTYTGVHEAFRARATKKSLRKFAESSWADFHNEHTAPIEVRGVFPPIIDEITFRRVQEQLTKNKAEARRNTKRDYFLRSLIRCGRCGRAFVGVAYPGTNTTHTYYRCSSCTATPAQSCGAPYLPLEKTDAAVWAEFTAQCEQGFQAARELEALHAEQQTSEASRDIARLRRQLNENENRTRRLMARGEESDFDAFEREENTFRLATLRTERAELTARIAEAETALVEETVSARDVARTRALTTEAAPGLAGLTPAERRELFDLLGVRITYYPDEHTLVVHLRTGHEYAVPVTNPSVTDPSTLRTGRRTTRQRSASESRSTTRSAGASRPHGPAFNRSPRHCGRA
jgi:site-specific DNA recombinase